MQRNEQGRPTAILETNNDITESKRWRSLTEALPQPKRDLLPVLLPVILALAVLPLIGSGSVSGG